MIRVAIFEDDKSVRTAYQFLLENFGNDQKFKLTGIFEDCTDTLHKIEKSNPHVVLMDIAMPGTSGIEGTSKIKAFRPEVNVLIQTVYEDEANITAALLAGANGYILKNAPPDKIVEWIEDVYHGGSALSAGIASKVIKILQQVGQPVLKPKDYALTEREKQVLQCMTSNKSLRDIGDELFLAYETIRSHVKSIYRKLHVTSGTEAVAKALRERII